MGYELLMTVFLSNPEGSRVFRAKVDGLKHDPKQLASDAYLAVAERGGADLLEGARQPPGSTGNGEFVVMKRNQG